MTKPSVILFDLGNVLVTFRPQEFLDHLHVHSPVERKKYQPKIIAIVQEFETGRVNTAGYLDKLFDLFNHQHAKEYLREASLSVLTDPIEGMEKLVEKVAGEVEIGLVSNTNELHFRFCQERIPALGYFKKYFLSYRLGAMKPNPNFYDRVLKELEIAPDQILFIDDIAENVEGAKKSGMNGIEFTGPDQLETIFRDTGILS